MTAEKIFTSESVTEGHPDKVCDLISDGVLDAVLGQDPYGRVACETLVTTDLAIIAGEITTKATVDFEAVTRSIISDIGYNDAEIGFDSKSCVIRNYIKKQSPDIAMGVDKAGAGDQGMMFGYAVRETPELMPLPIALAHKLTLKLAQVRKEGILPWLRPDGKSQVTIDYADGTPTRVNTVVLSCQHNPDVETAEIHRAIRQEVIDPVLPPDLDHSGLKVHINPTGRFVIGGPKGDTGVTGRKIIVDTYGGYAPHGGGCFSGKDPTKVDRSATYMARYLAKNIVASGASHSCMIQLAYAIGIAEPVSVLVDTNGTGFVSEAALALAIRKNFDLTPQGIIDGLNLRSPIYRASAAYGHFGRDDVKFDWEKTDKADLFKNL
ncbi:methionine adenosyltransferase [candidate division KSB1 bacterium]